MLIIERTLGSSIRIGSDIRIKVQSIPGSRRVRLGLEVPRGTLIWREEKGRPDDIKTALPEKRQLRVLIVEDDAAHAKLIEKGFKLAGHAESRSVGSAEEALELLDQIAGTDAEPNLITLDLDLGIGALNGIDMLREMHSNAKLAHIPVVMLSGTAAERDVSEALEAGANAVLAKTDDYTEFCNTVIRAAEFWRQNLPAHSTPVPGE